jgi:hypothetical protein
MQTLKFQCYVAELNSQTYDIYDVLCINMVDGTIKATKNGKEFNFLLANVVNISVKDETPCFMFEVSQPTPAPTEKK